MKNENTIPHSPDAEKAALGSVLLAGQMKSQAEVDALLNQLRPGMFYDDFRQEVMILFERMRRDGHAIDNATVATAMKAKYGEHEGFEKSNIVYAWPDPIPSIYNFPTYLEELKKCQLRRWTLDQAQRLNMLARKSEFDLAAVRSELSGFVEDTSEARGQMPVEFVTIKELREYNPDPKTFLVGNDMVSRGQISLIAGWAGLGKSRLANTLAFAGAKGKGDWMGYPVRRRFKTCVLQCENSMRRLKSESEGLPESFEDWIRFSKPGPLQFQRPEFRSEIRRFYDRWQFDVCIIDHWLEVAREEGQADHMAALDDILSCFPRGDDAPALVIVCHMRKQRGGESWRPKLGRELLSEISGSFAIGAKARTVFTLQPATMDIDDDRVIFDTAKCNNDTPAPMSAWYRRNGEFQPVKNFDFDAWQNPADGAGRKVVTEEILDRIFDGGKNHLARKYAVKMLVDEGFAEPTAYRALSPGGKFADLLKEENGLLTWRGGKAK